MNKTSLKSVGVALVLFASVSVTRGQFYLLNSNVWVTAQERMRIEYRENNVTFNDKIDKDTDLWLLQRARLGLGAKAFDWVRIFGELQDAREIDSTRFAAPPLGNADLEEDTIDWRQGWIEVSNYKEFPVGLKVGRQELSYGDERLIGAFDWNNVGRVFDAAKVRWQGNKFWVDVFAGDVVLNNVLSGRDNSFDDRAYWQDDLFGVYAQTTLLSFQATEGYVLLRDKDDAEFDGPAREIWTIGARVKSSAKLMPWDYYAEIAGQVGEVDMPGSTGTGTFAARRFGDNSLKNGVDHYALAAVVGGGFTFTNCPTQPRVGVEYNYASGDDDPNDGESNTFDNLHPTNHKFYGYMDLFAWKNIHNPRFTLSGKPLKTVTVQLDYHLFWLAEDEDFWYRANQAPAGAPARRDVTGNSDNFVGSEIDLSFTWVTCKYAKIHGGYSHFFRGGYVEDTANAPAGNNGTDDADFLYIQTTLGF